MNKASIHQEQPFHGCMEHLIQLLHLLTYFRGLQKSSLNETQEQVNASCNYYTRQIVPGIVLETRTRSCTCACRCTSMLK